MVCAVSLGGTSHVWVYMCVCVCICMHQSICMHSDRKGTVQKQITDDRCLCDCIKLARHIREKKKVTFKYNGRNWTQLCLYLFSLPKLRCIYHIYPQKLPCEYEYLPSLSLSLSLSLSFSLSLFLSFSLSVTMSDQWHGMLFVSLTPLWLHICVCQRSLWSGRHPRWDPTSAA